MQTVGRARSGAKPADAPTPVGSFNVTQCDDKADKIGKDDNFRGLTVYDNVLYYTKGSGGNGVNTVYFVDTSGLGLCHRPSAGVPQAGAQLPTTSAFTDNDFPRTLTDQRAFAEQHVHPEGLPDDAGANATDASDFPFGLWFANPDTVYVADEGSGDKPTPTSATKRNVYRRRRPDNGRPPEVGVRPGHRELGAGVYLAERAWTSASPIPCPGYPTGDNSDAPRGRGCRGRRPQTGCAISRVGSTRTGRSRSGPSRRRSAGAGTRGPTPTNCVDNRPGRGDIATFH